MEQKRCWRRCPLWAGSDNVWAIARGDLPIHNIHKSSNFSDESQRVRRFGAREVCRATAGQFPPSEKTRQTTLCIKALHAPRFTGTRLAVLGANGSRSSQLAQQPGCAADRTRGACSNLAQLTWRSKPGSKPGGSEPGAVVYVSLFREKKLQPPRTGLCEVPQVVRNRRIHS
jgi:hypothetical protein